MKISKSNLIVAICSIFILLSAIIVLILQYTLPDFKFLTSPIFNFFLILTSGFGIISFVEGFCTKSPWYFFCGAILFCYAIIYTFFQFESIWFVGIIVALVFVIIISILSFIVAGNKTESIALNTAPGYKNYEQRKAEELKQENSETKKELPKIKSFKD